MYKILRYLEVILLIIILIILMFDLYPTPQKTLNYIFLIGLIDYHLNKEGEE